MKHFFLLCIIVIFCIYNGFSNDNNALIEMNGVTVAVENSTLNQILLRDELPSDFPKMVIDSVNKPAPGSIFMESITIGGTTANYIMILDSLGKVVYYKKPENPGLDFKIQPNGLFSYCSQVKLGDKYQAGPLVVQNIMVQENILDSNYNVIDTVQMKNEYLADIHEFQILPNGNYMMIAYEGVPVDMSKVIKGGNPNAVVVGTVFQELDINKNCVFQWRSLDHIPILATKDDPLKATFEHVHGNSTFLDKDGNLIVSFPTTFEIVKIDMISGKMMWRFGGDNNQFEISGDDPADAPYYFKMQHDVKKLPNGNIFFYDNAVQKTSGWSSRAVEYQFDEANKKANLFWEYKHAPAISAYAMGSVQRLSNGNSLIDWGLIFLGLYKTVTEVTPNKEIAFELSLPSDAFSYRAHKYNLPACQPVAKVDKYEMLEGNTYKFNDKLIDAGVEIYFEKLDGYQYNKINVKKYDCAPLYPFFRKEAPVLLPCRFLITPKLITSFKGEIRFDVSKLPSNVKPENMIVYCRPKSDSGTFESLPSHYDITENQIIAQSTVFGEFIIGFERTAVEIFPPSLLYPTDNKILMNNNSVKIVWSSTGRYDRFQMQIAEDSLFSTIVKDSSGITTPIVHQSSLTVDKKYFWRTKTFYQDLISDWSAVRSFSFAKPFISIIYPNGGESLSIDSTYILKWSTNLPDSVAIILLNDGKIETTIKPGIFSYSNSFSWKIPKTVNVGSKYVLKVISLKDSTILAQSENNFSIQKPVGVEDGSNLSGEMNVIDITPNPSTEIAKIGFTLHQSSQVRLSVIDHLGIEKQLILDSYIQDGSYNFILNINHYQSGIYFCVLKDGNTSIVKKMVIIR